MTVRVRAARREDLEAIVGVHLRAFQNFFLTSLGPRFVFELYQGFYESHDARLIVAEVEGAVGGFAAGTLSPERFFRRLLVARWFRFGIAALGAVMQRPRTVLPRLFGALGYRGERPPHLSAAALLSAIAVDPRCQSLGIGSRLIEAFCNEASSHGLAFVYLTTDRDRNEASNSFYLRHGFKVESEIVRPNGRIMICYLRQVERRPGS
jgi:ribosomal protein S18 acetylase RimI-like enzyme